jgi:thioredoxin 1
MNYATRIVSAVVLMAATGCWAKEILNLNNKKDIDSAIKNNKMVIIDYHAERTCGPCQQVAKILPDLAKEFPEIQFVKVDVNEYDAKDIRSVPTFIFYKGQEQVKRITGSRSKSSFINLINDTFCLSSNNN